MEEKTIYQTKMTNLVGFVLLGILIFLMIPFSYGIPLPWVYWVNQTFFFYCCLVY